MINPGIHLCPACGRTSTGFYYASGSRATKLFQLVPGKKADTFILMDEDQVPYPLSNPEDITPENFPPLTLPASADGSQEETVYHWCCPECKMHFTTPEIAMVPGYVIAVMGSTDAGKTSWLGALSTTALGPLAQLAYPYQLELATYNTSHAPIQSTQTGDQAAQKYNNTNYLKIIHRETGQTVALVYLLDYGGELYKKQSLDSLNTPVSRLLRGKSGTGYTGVDALVLIEPADQSLEAKTREQINILGKISNVTNIPLAHVQTCGDKLLKQELNKSSNSDQPPLFTAKTFPATAFTKMHPKAAARHFTPQAIAQRLHLQNYIARRSDLGHHLEARYGARTRHFLVQSCVPVINANGEKENDYTKQFNTVDPLLWLLHELRLFPLTLPGG